VTLSYVICLGLVVVMGLIRFVSWWRQPRAVRRLGGRATGRTTHHVPDTPTHGIPDEEFWAEFKREAQLWTVSTK
jgi:hypothetical protein